MNRDNLGPAGAAHQWSIVLHARRQDTSRAMAALEWLCQAYWQPLYAYVRLRGHSPAEARELTQEFFSRLLQNKTLAYMKKDCGKLRSFLLTAMNHFLVDEARKGRLAKPEPLEDSPLTENLFEQNWALAVANVVYDRLKREYEELGKGELFAALKHCLAGRDLAAPCAEMAARLSWPRTLSRVWCRPCASATARCCVRRWPDWWPRLASWRRSCGGFLGLLLLPARCEIEFSNCPFIAFRHAVEIRRFDVGRLLERVQKLFPAGVFGAQSDVALVAPHTD